MTEEFEEIQQLQKDIYELNGELYENSKLMAEELSDMMNSHVRDLYKEEYIRIRSDYEIERRQKEFRTKERRAIYVPYSRRFLFFHRSNVAAKLIIEEANIEADRFFSECEAENDKNRPEYMPKMYLSRAQKREAKRIEREEARRERKEEKAKKARLRKLERDRKRKTKKERAKAQRDAEREERQKRREEQQAKRRRRAAEKSSKRIERRKQRLKRREERK